jgi:DNA-directed RNA polymerase specialized sigma24 family protein|tara:strand:+ start:316 stop:981 length:666 start_codon:yes stop_codon:yes gene_type:complete
MCPRTIEEFAEKYKDHVDRWVKWANRWGKYEYDKDDFWSSLIEKFIKKNTLEKYVEGRVKYLTWLNVVLKNHYRDGLRKHKPYIPFVSSIDELETEKAFTENTEVFRKWAQEETEIDFERVEELVEKIEDVKPRLLMKLLMFNPNFTTFTTEEKQFLAKNCGVSEDEINGKIGEIFKTHQKIRHKDIAELTGYAIGSIGQTFERTVRKYVIEPYLRMRIAP